MITKEDLEINWTDINALQSSFMLLLNERDNLLERNKKLFETVKKFEYERVTLNGKLNQVLEKLQQFREGNKGIN